MTARVVRWHEMLPSSSGELVPAVGGYRFTPTRARIISGDPDIEVLPESFVEPLVDGKLDVALEQTGVTWVWRVERNVHHLPKTIEYVAVPAGLDPIDQTDLIRIDPETLVPDDDLTPMWFAITSIVERNVTIIGNERILAETARDEATLAKDNAELAELSSETAQSLAEAALAAAIIAQNGSEHARDECFIAENNTNVLAVDALASADSANTSAINASNSALAASESKQAAQTAQSIAEIDRAGAELAETRAEIAQTAAQTARTGAETAQGAASGYATTASQQASIAMDQAVLAAGSASDAADAETAAQTAQGLAETARDAAEGARDAAQTAKGLAETARDAAALSASYADADRLAAQTAQGLAETARDAAAFSANNASATLAGAITKATIDAKGDLLVGSANDTIARLPVGADGSILVADSNTATGIGYQSPIPLLKNLIANGDFSNGATGWTGSANSGFAVASSVGSITATAQGEAAYQSVTLTAGHRYYIASTITVATTGTTAVAFGFASGAGSAVPTLVTTFAQRLSSVQVATASGDANLAVIDSRASEWTRVRLDNAVCIDLTSCFGAGNEPSKAEMDAYMARHANSWFANTSPQLWSGSDWLKRTQNAATNLILNGDFSNGTTYWLANGATIANTGGVLTITGDGTSHNPRAYFNTGSAIGYQYYAAASMRVTAAADSLAVYMFGPERTLVTSPVAGQWYAVSVVVTATTVGSAISWRHNYFDSATANGKVAEIKNVLGIDLTVIFGAGNEPTKTEMDYLLSKYPNSWFNGIVNDLKTNYDPMRRIGKGSPYSVITPRKAGETWTDLDQTCGARVWTATGTTTNSWVVTDGDTGVRILSSWGTDGVVTGDALPANVAPTPAAAGSVRLHRVGDRAALELRGLTWSGQASFIVPVGFRPSASRYAPIAYYSTASTALCSASGAIYMGKDGDAASTNYAARAEWLSGGWPTGSLPGAAW